MPTPTPTNYATSPTPTVATSPPIDASRVCHVTTATPPLTEGCGWTTSATSRLSTAATQRPLRAMSPGRTPALERHVMKPEEEGGSMGARREVNEEGKAGSRRKGKSQGDREEGGGSTCCPYFMSFRTGAAHAAPISFCFEQGSVCCPVSFHFEWGQHMLPLFLFINSGGGGQGGRARMLPSRGWSRSQQGGVQPSFEFLYSTHRRGGSQCR